MSKAFLVMVEAYVLLLLQYESGNSHMCHPVYVELGPLAVNTV